MACSHALNGALTLIWRLKAKCFCRCLSIEAPPPEEKLATLSDIAQEYSVEWDAHGAASEMLPPGAHPGFGDGPGTAGGPGQWGGPAGPGGSGGGGYGMQGPAGPQAGPDRYAGGSSDQQAQPMHSCRVTQQQQSHGHYDLAHAWPQTSMAMCAELPLMLVLAERVVRACACAGFQTGAPKVLPGQLDAGKTLPNQVQALAKEEWADAMSAAAAAAQHAKRAQDASDAAERYARNSTSSAPAPVSRPTSCLAWLGDLRLTAPAALPGGGCALLLHLRGCVVSIRAAILAVYSKPDSGLCRLCTADAENLMMQGGGGGEAASASGPPAAADEATDLPSLPPKVQL